MAPEADPAASHDTPVPDRGFQPLPMLRLAALVGPPLLLVVAGILWQQERARAVEEVNRSLEILRQHVARLA